ncbi:hypothetical protein CEXT_475651 [Caerostris extrusa]|uniref:Uncharacterized protein n=1 Tax=Caerostris extrusa TaxID=172846 RepID=A0AAV4N8R0_CAEEX|nr:hypothetical protein CEXT_475651 [Caerostris extrusa]
MRLAESFSLMSARNRISSRSVSKLSCSTFKSAFTGVLIFPGVKSGFVGFAGGVNGIVSSIPGKFLLFIGDGNRLSARLPFMVSSPFCESLD